MTGIQVPNIVVIGSINMDIVMEVPHIPTAGQTRIGTSVKLFPGGKGANQAVAAARLQSNTVLIGSVGKDAFGDQMLQDLENNGVYLAVTVKPDESTGVASIWLHNQDNRIIVVPGANNNITWEDVERGKALIDRADVVLLQMEIPFETVISSIEYAYRQGKKIVLNPAPACPLPDHIYPMLHCLTPNCDELSVLVDSPNALDPANMNAIYQAMEKLIAKGLPSIIVTLGSEGAIYMDSSKYAIHVPGKKMNVLDTTGAGDCFSAAIAVSIAKGWSIECALEYAVAASALAVTKLGAQNGMPRYSEVAPLFIAEREHCSQDLLFSDQVAQGNSK